MIEHSVARIAHIVAKVMMELVQTLNTTRLPTSKLKANGSLARVPLPRQSDISICPQTSQCVRSLALHLVHRVPRIW